MSKFAPLIVIVWLLAWSAPAGADNIQPLDMNFSRITDNSAQGDQVQLNLTVSQVDDNTLMFELANLSGIESVVSEIYFQDTAGLIARYQILNDQSEGNVMFLDGASPGNLPAGQEVSFNTSFAMQADNPSPKYGISPGETLKLYLNLADGVGAATLVESLQSQGFRVGVHVQSIAGDASESYVSNTPGGGGAAAPEPATLLLMGSALVAGWGVRRRTRKRA